MAKSLRRHWQRVRTLNPDALVSCAPGSRVLMSSTAGYANQVRSALAIASCGLTPLVQDHSEYRAEVQDEEGIDLGSLFTGLAVETANDRTAKVYRDWIVPPWADLDSAEAAQIYNALNFPGLVNASRLAHLPETRDRMRRLFDGFSPVLNRSDLAQKSDRDVPAIHLRMFGRNYCTRYMPLKKGADHARRYVKEAWSEPRLNLAASTLARVAADAGSGRAVAVYTDRHDDPAALRFLELARASGLDPHAVTSDNEGALGAMEESMRLSGHRRMVLTSTSSFGHLAALLAEDLEWVVSV